MSEQHSTAGSGEQQRRRIRRNAIVLALVALAIYATFIASGVLGLRG